MTEIKLSHYVEILQGVEAFGKSYREAVDIRDVAVLHCFISIIVLLFTILQLNLRFPVCLFLVFCIVFVLFF